MTDRWSDRASLSLSRPAIVVMAVAAGALAANLYYAQPVVGLIAADLALPPGLASLVVTASQIGYAAGLALLVPLGDVAENRRLILLAVGAAVLALMALAFSASPLVLFAATFVVGVASTAAQMIVPLVARFAPPERRGQAVGEVMTGLLGGILLARPLSSFLGSLIGWRGVFLASATLILVLLAASWRVLPRYDPGHRQRYASLIASLGTLFAKEPVLRLRALTHAALFAAFAVFWTAVPILLRQPPFLLDEGEIALFTLSGVLGVLAAPVAGRLADRGHARAGTLAAVALVLGALVLALAGHRSVALLVVAGILLDLGVQANLVIGQREIFQLDNAIRNRLNAVYMTTFFLGGALGSALTSPILERGGFVWLMAVGVLFPAAALVYLASAGRASGR